MLPFRKIGQREGLTSPAIAERVQRMEDAGIITGYRAEVNTAKIGYPITAIIRISNSPGERCTRLTASTQEIPEVLECHRVTGSDSLIMKIMASSVEHLEALIDRLSEHGQLTTSIVLSTVLSRKIVTRAEINTSNQKLETIA